VMAGLSVRAGRNLLCTATKTGSFASSRLFAHTLAVSSDGTLLNQRGTVLVTAPALNPLAK